MYQTQEKRCSAGVIVLTVFLSILLFVSLLATALLSAVHAQFSDAGIEKLSDGIDPYKGLKRALEDQDILPEDWLEKLINPSRRGLIRIAEEGLRTISGSDYFHSFLSDVIKDYVDDIRNESGSGRIRTKDIMRLIRRSEKDVRKYFGYSISDTDYGDIERFLDTVDLSVFDLDEIRSEYPEILRIAHLVLSRPVLWGSVALSLLLAVFIIAANIDFPGNWLSGTGGPMIAAGILLLIVRGGVRIGASFLPSSYRWAGFMALEAFGVLLSWILWAGVILTFAGIVLCAIGGAVNSRRKHSAALHMRTQPMMPHTVEYT